MTDPSIRERIAKARVILTITERGLRIAETSPSCTEYKAVEVAFAKYELSNAMNALEELLENVCEDDELKYYTNDRNFKFDEEIDDRIASH